ncbi:MAG: FixH family protein [Cyclobacteriaceae bacterium]
MNWGHKIAIVFIAFVGLMVFMVIKSFQVNVDLVAEDYYKQEIEFQQQIDKTNNASELAERLSFKQENQQLIIQFPALFEQGVHGEISFFRPSDKRFDVNTKITLDENHRQSISTTDLAKGYYKIKLDWKNGSKAYYHEESVFIH